MSSQTVEHPSTDRMTRFERGVVFRVARGFFFFVAIAAVVVFGIGALTGARGMAEPKVPEPRPLPTPAKPQPLTFKVVEAELGREAKEAAAEATDIEYVGNEVDTDAEEGEVDPLRARRDRASEVLRKLFPEPTYTWTNQVETRCVAPTMFGCMRHQTKVVKEGVVGIINEAVKGLSAEESLAMVETLVAVLKDAPMEERGKLVIPVARLATKQLELYREALDRHEEAVAALRQKYEEEVAATRDKHAELRKDGAQALGAGFAGVVIVSLFLAFLAIERHSRTLEMLATAAVRREQ
jgi:hypothetical protein